MPAWLVSLLFHVVLLIVLGLLTRGENGGPYITLSSRVSRVVREGGDIRVVDPSDNSVFDLGVPDSIDLEDPVLKRDFLRADQDARQLRLTDPTSPYLPDLQTIKQDIRFPTRRALAVRDPRVRSGDGQTRGWNHAHRSSRGPWSVVVGRHQNQDGSWSLDRFRQAASCRCNGRGSLESDHAGTALALLPFLGAGQTHLTGIYKDEVSRGLRWLVQQQKSNGDLRGSTSQYPGMYAQGQAAIVLCEAFLMTGDEELRVPAQRAIDFIVAAQYLDGGWRYFPNRRSMRVRGDTSVLGWQLMALQSAMAARFSVPQATIENAGHFLDGVQHADGARYAYIRDDRASLAMTAEGLLCRIYLGWKQNHPALREALIG